MRSSSWENKDITDENFQLIVEKIGMKIKLARIEQKLTVLQLSQINGMSDSYLSRVENGKVNSPGLRLYLRIFNSLGMQPSEFFKILDELPPFDANEQK